jgi:RNA polymerase sigma-70 factor (ECF subfamily)
MQEREREFDAFYRGTASRVVRLVYATTGDPALAQESTQEAYARAWADWGRVRTHDDPLSWVRTVARRVAISEWRKSRNRDLAHRRSVHPISGGGPGPDHVDVVAALRALPDDIRTVMVLYYVADLSVEAIALETGAPTGSVKARLHRGRQRLAPMLTVDDTTREEADCEPR